MKRLKDEFSRQRSILDKDGRKLASGRGHIPLLLEIVYLEAAVGRHNRRLHRTEIGANDLSPRVLVGHVERPNAGACPDTKNFFRIRQRAQVQISIELQELAVMLDVHAVQLLLVIGEKVCARLVSVITSPELFRVARQLAVERSRARHQ